MRVKAVNSRNRLRRAALVLALLVLAATVTGVAESAAKTAVPKQLIGWWQRGNGLVIAVGPRGNVKLRNQDGPGWSHARFSRVRAHRLSISGIRSCSGTGTYRWTITNGFAGHRLAFKKIHDACKPRVGLFEASDWGRYNGDRLNPYPLGTAVTLTHSWKLTVNSAILNADAQVEAVDNQPPPPAGAQYTLVNASMTYIGRGSTYLSDFLFVKRIDAEGAGNARYSSHGCVPPPLDLNTVGQVFSGQTVTGNLCFKIASNDAATLLLTGKVMAGDAELPVWFALR